MQPDVCSGVLAPISGSPTTQQCDSPLLICSDDSFSLPGVSGSFQRGRVAPFNPLSLPGSLKFRQRKISRVLAIQWELELRQWLLKSQLELLMVRSWSQSNPSQQNPWKPARPVSGVCPTEHMFGTWKRKGTSQGTWIRPVEQHWKLEHCYKAKTSLF